MKLRLSLACCAFVFAAWVLAPEAVHAQLDLYKCYQGKDLKNPKFNKNDYKQIDTDDQIITDQKVDVQKIKFVCNPAAQVGDTINNPDAHLICYQVKAANLSPRPKVQVSTQIQESKFEMKKAKLLCVPGTKSIIPPA